MSIDNIPTYYSTGYYNPSQAQAEYLNYDINTTTGSSSTEYIDLNLSNYLNPPLPTWKNKITVYTNVNEDVFTNGNNVVINLTNVDLGDVQQELMIVNRAISGNAPVGFSILYLPDGNSAPIPAIYFINSSESVVITYINGILCFPPQPAYIASNDTIFIPPPSSANINASKISSSIVIGDTWDQSTSVTNCIMLGNGTVATNNNQLVIGSETVPINTSNDSQHTDSGKFLQIILNGQVYYIKLYN